MDSPSPVPPYFRVMDVSAWINGYITKPVKQETMLKTISSTLKNGDISQIFDINNKKNGDNSSLPLDINDALANLGIHKKTYYQILGNFLKNNKHLEKDITSAAKENKVEDLIRIFHSLKSSTGSIGGKIVEKKSSDLEKNFIRKINQSEITEKDHLKINAFLISIHELMNSISHVLKKVKG